MGEGTFLVQKIKSDYQKSVIFPKKIHTEYKHKPQSSCVPPAAGYPWLPVEITWTSASLVCKAHPFQNSLRHQSPPYTHAAQTQTSLEETTYPGSTPTRNLEASSFPTFQESSPNSDRKKTASFINTQAAIFNLSLSSLILLQQVSFPLSASSDNHRKRCIKTTYTHLRLPSICQPPF